MKNSLGLFASVIAIAAAGCGGSGSYVDPFKGNFKGTAQTYQGVTIPDVTTTDTSTVTITVDANNDFTADLSYFAKGSTTPLHTIVFTGTVTGSSNDLFTCTETDAGGPYTGQTLEVYYHTFGPSTAYPKGYTSIAIYKPGFTSITSPKAWSLTVVSVPSAGGTTTTTQ